MNKKLSLLAICVFMMAALSAQDTASGNEVTFKGWHQAETEHFRFIFEDASRQATEVYAQYADDAWNKISKAYAIPQNKTDVYVTARTNTVNAFTFYAPTEIMMFTSPLITPEFGFRDNWQKLFFTHELVHVANLHLEDKKHMASKMFGEFMHSLQLASVPGWALEGLTTVMETELTNGGRGRSPFFELMYKAPTLDNGFISYANIGLESEPPRGQSYVMGYLIMRSIADRWGMQALADIERNRTSGVTWEDSVYLVTGEKAEDIYKDVRIALAKKYSSERTIPEGIIISPRNVGTYYYKPAVVADDGTLIALRSSVGDDSAVVRFDPSARSGSGFIEDAHPEKNLNTVMKETILFTGDFSDQTAVTATADGTVYASLAVQRNDRAPGVEIEYALFKWTKETGLIRLTKNASLFSPTVSRDGKILVAVEQHGLKMQLVNVDTVTGKITPLLQNDAFDFIEPALNKDGTKIAFLKLDDTRAAVAMACMISNNDGSVSLVADEGTRGDSASVPMQYSLVANGDGKILDPAFPSWNQDGSLLYTCNTRGRLEVFEVSEENGIFISIPRVADPIGATWAYKTDRGIYYASYASTGNVIKMKPTSEWGVVPQFDGPSPAGEVIHFGSLENDYPDFKPYDIPSEHEIALDKEEDKTPATDKKPVAVRGKTVIHRSEENIKRAEELNSVQVTLQNEKLFLATPKPILYAPAFDVVTSGENNENWDLGYGYCVAFLMPKLQMNIGIGTVEGFYYPKINNFSARTMWSFPIGASRLTFILSRSINNTLILDGDYTFQERNYFVIGGDTPIVRRAQHANVIDLSLVYSGIAEYERHDTQKISMDSTLPLSFSIGGKCGIDFSYTKQLKKDYTSTFNASASGRVGWYKNIPNAVQVGFEGGSEYLYGNKKWKVNLELRGRYTDFPSATIITYDRTHRMSEKLDCTYPGRLVGRFGYVMPNGFMGFCDMELFAEGLVSFGKNTIDYETPDSGLLFNITPDKSIIYGIEANYRQQGSLFACGYTFNFNFDDMSSSNGKFYVSLKFGWFQI